MTERELTREQVAEVLIRITGATPNDANLRRHILAHDAALRAERDKYKTDSAAWEEQVDELLAERDSYKRKYEVVLNNAAYGECCEIRAKIEAERDALKVEVEEIKERAAIALASQARYAGEQSREVAYLTRQLAECERGDVDGKGTDHAELAVTTL